MQTPFNHFLSKLKQNDVHVWRSKLICTDLQLQQHQSIISEAEYRQAMRLVKVIDQRKYIIAKAIVRKVLARYLSIYPRDIVIMKNQHGKPFVQNTALQFNTSHSGDYLLIAVTRDQSVGVDVEQIRDQINFISLAKRFFTEKEYHAIQSSDQPQCAFYRCWTRKEAFVKALGYGLSFGLSCFEVSVLPSEYSKSYQSDLIAVRNEQSASGWTLRSLVWRNWGAYYAALCVRVSDPNCVQFDI